MAMSSPCSSALGCQVYEVGGKVFPCWIRFFDQRDLLLTLPAFDSLFGCDRVADLAELVTIDETVDLVSFRKLRTSPFLVLQNSCGKVVGDADRDRVEHVREDVDPVASLHSPRLPRFRGPCHSEGSRTVSL